MQKQDFHFDLPTDLIAEKPCEQRSGSRLLVINPQTNTIEHKQFYQLVDSLNSNDCLIFNNTKVIPARLIGKRLSGGRVEILIERLRLSNDVESCIAQVRASNSPKPGVIIAINDEFKLEVVGREGDFFELKNLSNRPLAELVEEFGDMPLPPYIERQVEEFDKKRYQTVYAEKAGAVAAPTAGLHFDLELLEQIELKGVKHDFVTLHVGAGTFAPIRVENITEH